MRPIKTLAVVTFLIIGLPSFSMDTQEGEQSWAGKCLTLSGKRLNKEDCQDFLSVPVSTPILNKCLLGEKEALILSQMTQLKKKNLLSPT